MQLENRKNQHFSAFRYGIQQYQHFQNRAKNCRHESTAELSGQEPIKHIMASVLIIIAALMSQTLKEVSNWRQVTLKIHRIFVKFLRIFFRMKKFFLAKSCKISKSCQINPEHSRDATNRLEVKSCDFSYATKSILSKASIWHVCILWLPRVKRKKYILPYFTTTEILKIGRNLLFDEINTFRLVLACYQ